MRAVLRPVVARQAQQSLTELRGEHGRQRAILRRLDAKRVDTGPFGVLPHLIQQDCLPDPPKPDHEDALRRKLPSNPFESHPCGLEQLVPARKLGRRRPRTGRERIGNGIHGAIYTGIRGFMSEAKTG